ncbi:calcineurin-like phosphoesterase-domain-containing protein [Emericellopsis atlantica]|uniref:Calcineurin-like phosphoesterase-domain-containing protein n=1 Tax=Emericellopsis atlantica TaxID=2614577 RepID=A0A9P7ZTM8_9HYPO|nr:calcineurin-like phosphoesterase-domain-containing protein [Emericellopsis atlantica]KAG9258154.1 calcineurin-like phosphoesterase-domain-containing protein [Emericellopsis atlantica]
MPVHHRHDTLNSITQNSITQNSITHSISILSFRLWNYLRGPTPRNLWRRAVHRLAVNLTPRRVLSFPHLLVGVWMVVLLWGERWVFDSRVASCDWDHWEDWPKDATPHHLIFVADPQIIDPHSYPGRPWPLSPLTLLVTDNYLLRGYKALQYHLAPDSLFFLGDLFDGGREWSTARGEFVDPKWGRQRSGEEKEWVDTWRRKYGEDYWLGEYARFGNIFFDHFNEGGQHPGKWQRGKKLVASLPGNHDLGFGAQVQVPVRDRFEAFFGEVNRVDVVGNHSFVSVDSVSLSADVSEYRDAKDLTPIYGPVNEFLDKAQDIKRKRVHEELKVWHGDTSVGYGHKVEGLDAANSFAKKDVSGVGDLPTILLSHVPLWRPAGTPCGPRREHWPPAKPPKGQTEPVNPDHRNALSIAAGYQYQNVLSESDSKKLFEKVGNVVNVFSGDDHDYCEILHPNGAREITVKSLSMAMGVPTPGFQMLSLWNPIDAHGHRLSEGPTVQTHLCLLPNQLHTYMRYVGFIIVSLVVLAVRAMLVPVLNLQPFALEQHEMAGPPLLPTSKGKHKMEPPITQSGSSSWAPRARASSLTGWASSKRRGGPSAGPRIHLDEDLYDNRRGKVDGRRVLGTVGREMWTMTWRVTWMAVLWFAFLAREW